MSTTPLDAVGAIAALIAELEQDLAALRIAHAVAARRHPATTTTSPKPTPKPRARANASAKPTSRPARSKRSGGGAREKLTLQLIRETPGITAGVLAAAMGIKPNYLYRVLPRLEREGQIRKQGNGYYPTEETPAADA